MDLPLPALLIALPLALALVATVVGRWPRVVVVVGTVSALAVALAALLVAGGDEGSLSATWTVLGRSLELTQFSAHFLALLAVGTAFLFALQWNRPGAEALVPGGLAGLAFLAAALMARPFAFGAVFLLAATAVTMPALYGRRPGAAAAAWRAFLAVALALPLLIAAGWLLDAGQAQSDAAAISLMLATLLLLGGFPFYVWINGIARTAPLPALVLLLGVVAGGAAVWLAEVLALFPLGGAPVYQVALIGSALLSLFVGAFGLARLPAEGGGQWRDWLAYSLVLDAGLQVAAMVAPGPAVAVVAVGALGRLLALLLLVGLSGWAPAQGNREAVRRLMMAYAGLMLIGLPLTPAFGARWEVLIALAGQSPLVAALALMAMGVAAVAGVRYALVADWPPGSLANPVRWNTTIPVTLLVIFALFMGLLSGHLLEYLARLAAG